MAKSKLSAYRAYAASEHYAVTLLVQAEDEEAALRLLDNYCRVELLGRAQVDIIMDAADASDAPLANEYVYWPHLWLMPYRTDRPLPAEPVTVLERRRLAPEDEASN